MMTSLIRPGTGSTEDQVSAIEARIGAALPADYREFLLSHGGGHIREKDGRYIAFKAHGRGALDIGGEAILDSLYRADVGASESWHDAYWSLIESERRIPNDTIPIGHDPGSNEILIGISGENRGKIFLWIRDLESALEGSPPSYDNVMFISTSFTEFLQGTYSWRRDQNAVE